MATKISFLNLKGGVGKTSLIVNVAACLAYMGKRVLVVDLDAQSNASIWLMRLDRWNLLNREPEKFILSLFQKDNSDIASLIQKSPVKNNQDETIFEGLDLIPASFKLMDLEHELPNPREEPFYLHFHKQMLSIENEYDYILFDCPPNFLFAPQCAVFTSDHIVVPANADALSIIGFHLLSDKLTRFKIASDAHREAIDAPDAEVLGVVLNAVKPGTNIKVPVQRIQAQIERFIEQGKASELAEIFPTYIRHSVTVGRAVMQGRPMVAMTKREGSAPVAEDYIKTTQRLMELVEKTEALLQV